MRIISGKYKSKKLESPKSDNIRPTGDKVKQALFTKLHFEVLDATVLDLFSGSGALGIEAISNGAKKVVFVDKDRRSVALTKKNLSEISNDSKVINADYKTALSILDEKFDIILVDPPYASGFYDDVLSTIFEKNLLSENGIIVCEHPNGMAFKNDSFEIFDQKRYGTVTLTYFRKKEN